MPRVLGQHRAAVGIAVASLTAVVGLGPVVAGALGTAASAASANCTASSPTGQLNESGFTGSTNAPSSTTDAAQNAITNVVNNTPTGNRFSSDEAQASGLYFQVNMGSAQSFNEIQMAAVDYGGDYARGFNVNVSSNGSSWTTVASCTSTAYPQIVSFPSQTAQYVQVVLTQSVSPNWWSMQQFFVYNNPSLGGTTTTAATTTTTGATTTTAAGANCSATASGTQLSQSGWTASTNTPASGGDVASNAIDGNLTTR
ncbi:MAG TPA: discoidin domain-containing protein, partial [Acidimicrobiales bacterium]|nr:discoidin domain-containing protein [Acidimicrobiales bacterium]